ncbi:MAG: methyltransferase [Puniceicoccales bacterium]|jgi:ribosomal protein L3 glutamine methyltransferase|nr:methyltransferase [Puniceicoccales bacterium]
MKELFPARDDADLLTIRDWLRRATSVFTHECLAFGQGATNAADEALWLIAHTLSLPRDGAGGIGEFLDARLTADEKFALREILCRRAEDREPAAYITGEAWLGDYSFRADERVIIPRSYFLEIIPDAINPWLENPDSVRAVADVCTGSGCLAILLAEAYPNATVDAFDISQNALDVAAENVSDYELENRIALWRADVFQSPERAGGGGGAGGAGSGAGASAGGDHLRPQSTYDIIVSNPPYEPESVLKTLPPEFRQEPAAALVSGADGMDVIRRLLPQAAKRLAPNGVLVVEIGGLHDTLEAAYPNLEINWLTTADATDCVALFRAHALRELFC